jgi:hypothetical protein
MAGGNLNVVFHGLFAFVVHEDCLEVLIPQAPALPAHQYNATTTPGVPGLTLEPGASYQLCGITGSEDVTRFPGERFPVVERYRVIDRTAARLHGSIYMPFPNRIRGLRQIPVGEINYFQGRASSKITTKFLPLVYVLRYEFANPADIRLDAYAVPAAAGNVNLHVYAEPGALPVPANYATTAFSRLVRLFPGLDLELVNSGWEYTERLPQGTGVNQDRDQRSLIELAEEGDLRAPERIPDNRPTTPICISLVVDNT